MGIVALVAVLGHRRRVVERARFPRQLPVTRLPIRAPLVRPDLTVMADLRASDRKSTSVWMTVDSGATGVTMEAAAYYALGLDALRGVTVRQEDPTGRVIHRDAGMVPQMVLGPLVIDDVVTALGGGATVLGQSILSHSTWEIDWDRGILTLNGAPWSDAVVLPLRKEGDSEIVTITVDGAPIDMVLDTGAFVSTIPESMGAGLASRRLPPTTLHSLTGELIVRRLFTGNVKLGSLDVGTMEFAAIHTGGRRASLGLLGLDVLSRYELQVVPGSRIALRPRVDVAPSERIGRWAFLPKSCEHVGCVQASIAADGDHAKLTVTLDADLAEPIEVLFGCDHGVITRASYAFGRPPAIARHVRVRLPRGSRGSSTTMTNGASWFEHGCAQLEALDVSPIVATSFTASEPEPTGSELQAMFWP